MPQKERNAWVWLVALVVCMGAYFIAVVTLENLRIKLPFLAQIGMLAAATLTMAAVVLGNQLRNYLHARSHEAEGADERDRLIEYRATRAAYFVLMTGMILVGCIMPLDPTKSGWDVVNAALFYIVLAEVVNQVLIVRGYRKGLRV